MAEHMLHMYYIYAALDRPIGKYDTQYIGNKHLKTLASRGKHWTGKQTDKG